MDLNEIMARKIIWKATKNNVKYFYAIIDGKTVYLRLNNFPEEPAFTIIFEDSAIDLDERPIEWDWKLT